MKTTIKNKQTGETLTGEKGDDSKESLNFAFRITGTGVSNVFRTEDWEVMPLPLPNGIGAVVKDSLGNVFVRIFRNSTAPWQILHGEIGCTDQEVNRIGQVTVLSEGVTL